MSNFRILRVRNLNGSFGNLWNLTRSFVENQVGNLCKEITSKRYGEHPIALPISASPPAPIAAATKDQKRIKVDIYRKPYWEERGWTKEGNKYMGQYRTRYASCPGRIIDRVGDFDVFIFKPPKRLEKHPHWSCFRPTGMTSEYKLHFVEGPKDVSSAICGVEEIMAEAFQIR